jgi:hypothetical protein
MDIYKVTMRKSEIYKIFESGIDFGIEHGFFPNASLLDHLESLTPKQDKETKSLMWTVLIAGFNVGSNLKPLPKPTDEVLNDMFERLISGRPLEEGDNMSYAIKEKIDKLIGDE